MSNEATLRFPGIKVSDLLRAADEHGMWQVSAKEFQVKVKEMTQGSETFAEKYLDAKPSNYFFLSHSWNAACSSRPRVRHRRIALLRATSKPSLVTKAPRSAPVFTMPSYPVPAMPAVDDILSGLSSAL